MVHAPQDEVLTGVEVEESADDLLAPVAPPLHERVRFTLSRRWQKFLDDVNPHLSLRWIATGSLFFLYCLRIYYVRCSDVHSVCELRLSPRDAMRCGGSWRRH